MTRTHGPVSVLGTGAVGTAVARVLLAAGRSTHVWNRTPANADALVADGAVLCATAKEALTAAPLAIVTVTDHAAAGALLVGVDDADLSGHTVAVLVTGSAADARATADEVAALGATYLGGGLQAMPDMLGGPEAGLLLSGSAAAFDEHRATIELLGTARYLGDRPDAAAAWELALYGAWYDAQLGLLRALDLARGVGIDLDVAAPTLTTQLDHVARSAPETVAEVRDDTAPPGPASLAGHLPVLRQLLAARAGARLGDGGLGPVLDRVERAIAAGRHDDGLTALIAP